MYRLSSLFPPHVAVDTGENLVMESVNSNDTSQ